MQPKTTQTWVSHGSWRLNLPATHAAGHDMNVPPVARRLILYHDGSLTTHHQVDCMQYARLQRLPPTYGQGPPDSTIAEGLALSAAFRMLPAGTPFMVWTDAEVWAW